MSSTPASQFSRTPAVQNSCLKLLHCSVFPLTSFPTFQRFRCPFVMSSQFSSFQALPPTRLPDFRSCLKLYKTSFPAFQLYTTPAFKLSVVCSPAFCFGRFPTCISGVRTSLRTECVQPCTLECAQACALCVIRMVSGPLTRAGDRVSTSGGAPPQCKIQVTGTLWRQERYGRL